MVALPLDHPDRKVRVTNENGRRVVTWNGERGLPGRTEGKGGCDFRRCKETEVAYMFNVLEACGVEAIAFAKARSGDVESQRVFTGRFAAAALARFGFSDDGDGPVFVVAATPVRGEWDLARLCAVAAADVTGGSVCDDLELVAGVKAPPRTVDRHHRGAFLHNSSKLKDGASLAAFAGRRLVAVAATLQSGATLDSAVAVLRRELGDQEPEVDRLALVRLVGIRYPRSCSGELAGDVQDARAPASDTKRATCRASRAAQRRERLIMREGSFTQLSLHHPAPFDDS